MPEELQAVAFENPNGQLVLLILNETTEEKVVNVKMKKSVNQIRIFAKSMSTILD
jgi:O-glycosyl hydrolase